MHHRREEPSPRAQQYERPACDARHLAEDEIGSGARHLFQPVRNALAALALLIKCSHFNANPIDFQSCCAKISPFMNYTSTSLRRAAEITEEIEELERQLNNLFSQGDNFAPVVAERLTKTKAKTKARALKRQPRGLLSSAVLEVLKASKTPLNAAQIHEGLRKKKFYRSSDNPKETKKILGIRLYRLAGVKALGKGLFAPAA
jgi:hypothetical protein